MKIRSNAHSRCYFISSKELQCTVLFEDCSQGFVLPHEADADEAIPFPEVEGGRGFSGLYPDHTGIHFWRGPEIISPNLAMNTK